MARSVAGEVNAKLTPPEKVLLAGARPANPEAYSDPAYAPAHAALAQAYVFKHQYSANDPHLLKGKVLLSKSPIDIENLQPYDLAITTSSDGTHYQITLQRPSDMNDKSTWCKTAAFSDDRGVIFLGQAIDCEAAPR